MVQALKQRAASEEGKRVVGMPGSLIDLRMGVVLESEREVGSGSKKALWLPGERRFVVTGDFGVEMADLWGFEAFEWRLLTNSWLRRQICSLNPCDVRSVIAVT